MAQGLLEQLKRAVLEYDSEGTSAWARKAVEEGVDPTLALDALTEAVRIVGDGFGRGELFLPELVGASRAMLAATPTLEAEIRRRGVKRARLGTVVIGTVFGDIHSIGKSMVASLLTAGGFEVHDLGVNIPASGFVEAVRRYQPDILAMSALMTTTVSEQVAVIRCLELEGLRDRVKVMVGGGGVTQQYAADIGADGYDPTAPGAVILAKKLLGR
ncbi:MAG: cobalamin-dependent protein [Anaerolineae bacterium]|nr:cobalamin-dependent protein [Anaerolineae bacterium]